MKSGMDVEIDIVYFLEPLIHVGAILAESGLASPESVEIDIVCIYSHRQVRSGSTRKQYRCTCESS